VERLFVLTDSMWEQIEPHLPKRTRENWKGRGAPGGDHRRAVEGIMWRFRTGSPWRDLPADYGAWQTIYWRFNTWPKDGTFNRILAELQADADADLEWTVSIDSSNARAHKHAAGAASIDAGLDAATSFSASSTA
jgi:transposase